MQSLIDALYFKLLDYHHTDASLVLRADNINALINGVGLYAGCDGSWKYNTRSKRRKTAFSGRSKQGRRHRPHSSQLHRAWGQVPYFEHIYQDQQGNKLPCRRYAGCNRKGNGEQVTLIKGKKGRSSVLFSFIIDFHGAAAGISCVLSAKLLRLCPHSRR